MSSYIITMSYQSLIYEESCVKTGDTIYEEMQRSFIINESGIKVKYPSNTRYRHKIKESGEGGNRSCHIKEIICDLYENNWTLYMYKYVYIQ